MTYATFIFPVRLRETQMISQTEQTLESINSRVLTRPLPVSTVLPPQLQLQLLVMHACELDGQHPETGDKCPNPKSKRNQCWQANQSVGRYSRCCSQETKQEQPQHPDVCPRLVSMQITGSTSLSIRDTVWASRKEPRPSSLAATVCQIQLLTDPISYHQIPTCHQPTFGSSSYPGVPSVTVAIADRRQSMFIQSI